MLQTNQNNSSCAFAEQMISYLYGEADKSETNLFKTHLSKCSTCAGEFAAFGHIRSSVIEWREADFADLKTPRFEFPSNATANIYSASQNESESWLNKFWKQFSFKPLTAVAALTILTICGGMILIALKFSANNEFANNLNNKNSTYETAVSPTVEKKVEETKISIAKNNNEKFSSVNSPKVAENSITKETIQIVKQNASKNPTVKGSTKTLRNNNGNTTAIDVNDKDTKTTVLSSKQKKAPTLTDTDEDEDDSIRLADLFAEIDTK